MILSTSFVKESGWDKYMVFRETHMGVATGESAIIKGGIPGMQVILAANTDAQVTVAIDAVVIDGVDHVYDAIVDTPFSNQTGAFEFTPCNTLAFCPGWNGTRES
jgi:hypothetical protein